MLAGRSYGSFDKADLMSQSVDATEWEKKKRSRRRRKNEPRLDYSNVEQKDEYAQTSAEILFSTRSHGALCNTSYIVEPVAFIQNLATSIMGRCGSLSLDTEDALKLCLYLGTKAYLWVNSSTIAS